MYDTLKLHKFIKELTFLLLPPTRNGTQEHLISLFRYPMRKSWVKIVAKKLKLKIKEK